MVNKGEDVTAITFLYGGEKRALRAGLDQLSNKPNSNLDTNSNTYLYIFIHITILILLFNLLFNLLVIILSSLLYSLIFNLLVFSLSGVIYSINILVNYSVRIGTRPHTIQPRYNTNSI